MRDVVNSALFYCNHKQSTNFLCSYSFIFCFLRFPFAWNQALQGHNPLFIQVTPRLGFLRKPSNYPAENTVSLFLSTLLLISKHKTPEERQGVSSGTKEIFSWKEELFLSKQLERQRQQLGERIECILTIYMERLPVFFHQNSSGSLSQIMCYILLEIALVTQIAEDSAVIWVCTYWDLHFWL